MPALTLSDRLRGLRAERGLSQDQVVAALAERGHTTTQATLSGWERRSPGPRLDILQSLAAIYGVDVGEIARLPVLQPAGHVFRGGGCQAAGCLARLGTESAELACPATREALDATVPPASREAP